MAGFLTSLFSGAGSGMLSPASYMGASVRSGQAGEQARQMAWDRRMSEKRFNIENMLAMQNYRSNERSKQWRRDLMYALGGLGG